MKARIVMLRYSEASGFPAQTGQMLRSTSAQLSMTFIDAWRLVNRRALHR